MRGLWRVVAMMAENAGGFTDELAKVTSTGTTKYWDALRISADPTDGQYLSLNRQPTAATLTAVDGFLRGRDPKLCLTWYELAEVNRLSVLGQTKFEFHGALKKYWEGVSAVAAKDRSNDLMEAIGGLAADKWTRDQVRAKPALLLNWFNLTQEQAQSLAAAIPNGSPTEEAAQTYAALGWFPKCASVISADDTWFHINI